MTTERPIILDLFCGAGGAAAGYHRAGFDPVGVDIKPQPRYPFTFIQADALEYLARAIETGEIAHFAAIHASPPCQAYSITQHVHRHSNRRHPDLVAPTRELLKKTGRPYVIENVPGAPLDYPMTLCGSSFGLRVRRHRLFETSLYILAPPCQHKWQDDDPIYAVRNGGKTIKTGVAYVFGDGGGKARAHWKTAMQMPWADHNGIAQAIPPAYTEYIGRHMRPHV